MNQYSIKGIDLKVFPSRKEMGKEAANNAEEVICKLLKDKDEINCIFAAAPSQLDFLNNLMLKEIDWSRINAFHMDEYIGLKKGDDNSFGTFLSQNLFQHVPLKNAYYINGASEPSQEIQRYTSILNNSPIDIVFCGIGENGHIAFNDPPVDFNDNEIMKKVSLDAVCRWQQVHDGCFHDIDEVPTQALTLSVPFLCKATYIFCIVPLKQKALAVHNALEGSVTGTCPASYLQKSHNVRMYIDQGAASMLSFV